MPSRKANERAKVVKTTCSYDCGSRCLLNVHLADGAVSHITTDDRPGPGVKACARGLSQKDVVYAPDRLTKPLRRSGERGSGKFETLSWGEALDKVAAELKRVKDRYGAESIYLIDYFASQSPLHNTMRVGRRFFSLFGGYTTTWGNTSLEAALFSSQRLPGMRKAPPPGEIPPWRRRFSHPRQPLGRLLPAILAIISFTPS